MAGHNPRPFRPVDAPKESADLLVGLGVLDRITLLKILPQQGSVTTARAVDTLKKRLNFSDTEIETFGLKTEAVGNQQMTFWDDTVDSTVEISISARAAVIVEDTLRELDKAKKIEAEHLSLWDKFVHDDE